MGFITRNLKRKGIKIGMLLIVVGVCSGVFAYYNAKPNINSMTYENIPVVAEKIDGIGEETLTEVVKNQPYDDMDELKQVPNVGKERYKIIKKHFSTHDICRIGYFYLAIFIMIVCIAFGANWMAHVTFKQYTNTGNFFRTVLLAIKGDEEEPTGKRFKRK